ncbi:putative phospholipase c [Diaporthe ampelina]|uniref:Phosphoinositide phospholipase C n=1 Tax=Diaporthe ampelina TaxID=1214573 RepID=A0A0G2F4N1_9PEZI|nr:putative phospholipase c [Diaporthe ampelina]
MQKETKACAKEIPSGRTFSFPEFCDFWYEHASHAKKPIDLDKADFDKPISNYYINSSHNTYIGDGDQVIRRGCRAIRDVAFEQTDLPLIISLEDHTTGDQHKEMVKIMREEWPGLLLEDPLPGCDPETQQPRVVDLKRKILIKGRRKAQKRVPGKPDLERKAPPMPNKPSIPGSSLKAKMSQMSAKEYYRAAQQTTSSPDERQFKDEKVHDALDRLAIYTYSTGPFKSFNSKDSDKPAHIFSFSEEKLKALHRTKHKDIFQHNKNYLARTFPASLSAFLSTNPNLPTLFWRKGVQMVSLNWQSWDTAMHLNDAMFDDTHGWVLKPPGYQSNSSATCQAHVTGKRRLSLCITVLGGQNIPMPRVVAVDDSARKTSPSVSSTIVNGDLDVRVVPATPVVHDTDFRPKVKCYLHVESHGERDHIKKLGEDEICLETRPAETQHPAWPEEESTLQFPIVSHVVEELSFLRFRVEHSGFIRDQATAWACIRLDRLQEGYRLISLKDPGGGLTEGMLLVKVEKTILDEPPRLLSLRAKTWNACKKGRLS